MHGGFSYGLQGRPRSERGPLPQGLVFKPHSDKGLECTNKELADYLHIVDRDDKLFASYFWWREYYTVKVGRGSAD